jgi:hypothetical protein
MEKDRFPRPKISILVQLERSSRSSPSKKKKGEIKMRTSVHPLDLANLEIWGIQKLLVIRRPKLFVYNNDRDFDICSRTAAVFIFF